MTRPSSKSLNFCSNNLSFLELIGHLFIMKLNQTLNFNFEMFIRVFTKIQTARKSKYTMYSTKVLIMSIYHKC